MSKPATASWSQRLPGFHRSPVPRQCTLQFRRNRDSVWIVDPEPHLDAIAHCESASATHRA